MRVQWGSPDLNNIISLLISQKMTHFFFPPLFLFFTTSSQRSQRRYPFSFLTVQWPHNTLVISHCVCVSPSLLEHGPIQSSTCVRKSEVIQALMEHFPLPQQLKCCPVAIDGHAGPTVYTKEGYNLVIEQPQTRFTSFFTHKCKGSLILLCSLSNNSTKDFTSSLLTRSSTGRHTHT